MFQHDHRNALRVQSLVSSVKQPTPPQTTDLHGFFIRLKRTQGIDISEITIIAAACPFDLSCSLQETDDRIPSFRLAVSLAIPHHDGEFKYQASNIWFACKSFDQFLSALNNVSDANDGEAVLADLSDFFNIRITNTNGNYMAEFNVRQRDVNYPDTTMNARCRMERESVQYVFTQFKQMPRWW